MSEMKSIALVLGEQGFSIFPVKENSKTPPLVKNWPERATSNIEQIKEWWTKYPHANIGIATGGNLLVIDLDKHGGNNGIVALSEWIKANGKLPKTYVVETPSGGRHLYYRTEQDVYNKTSLLFNGSGIDIRGKGGYVIAPGSVVNSKPYIIKNDVPIAAANESVFALCRGENRVITDFDGIIEGHRNDTIFKYVCKLQGQGVPDKEIYMRARNENDMNCVPPLSKK